MGSFTDKGMSLILRFTNNSLEPYQDAYGKWKIGYQSSRDLDGNAVTSATPKITPKEASFLLDRTMAIYIASIEESISITMPDNAKSALAVLMMNIGPAVFNSSMLKKVLNEDNMRPVWYGWGSFNVTEQDRFMRRNELSIFIRSMIDEQGYTFGHFASISYRSSNNNTSRYRVRTCDARRYDSKVRGFDDDGLPEVKSRVLISGGFPLGTNINGITIDDLIDDLWNYKYDYKIQIGDPLTPKRSISSLDERSWRPLDHQLDFHPDNETTFGMRCDDTTINPLKPRKPSLVEQAIIPAGWSGTNEGLNQGTDEAEVTSSMNNPPADPPPPEDWSAMPLPMVGLPASQAPFPFIPGVPAPLPHPASATFTVAGMTMQLLGTQGPRVIPPFGTESFNNVASKTTISGLTLGKMGDSTNMGSVSIPASKWLIL